MLRVIGSPTATSPLATRAMSPSDKEKSAQKEISPPKNLSELEFIGLNYMCGVHVSFAIHFFYL